MFNALQRITIHQFGHRNLEHSFEQVAVDLDVERPVLKLGHAPCDRKSQTITFYPTVTRPVASCESLHKFFLAHIKFGRGCVLKDKLSAIADAFQRQIHTGPRLRILTDIIHKVIEYPPHTSAVRHYLKALFGKLCDQRQTCFLKFVFILTFRLQDEDCRLAGFKINFEVARGRFRCLNKIFCKPLKSLRLPYQNLRIFSYLRVLAFLTGYKVSVVYY